MAYKSIDYWAWAHQCSIAWNDPGLANAWTLAGAPIFSGLSLRATEAFGA